MKNHESGKTFVGINCGANVNFDRLRHIAERSAVGKKSEVLLAVEINEEPGSFKKFCESIGKRNITEFNYRYSDKASARVFVGISLDGRSDDKKNIISKIKYSG